MSNMAPVIGIEEDAADGQILIWNLMLSYAQSIALKAVVALGIPDIIAKSPGGALSVEEIASQLQGKAVQKGYLARIMKFLASRGAFSESIESESGGEAKVLYSHNEVSRCLVTENNPYTLFPMVRLHLDTEWNRTWHFLDTVVLDGANPWMKAHGEPLYIYTGHNPGFSQMFSAAMASLTKPAVADVLGFYQGFKGVKTLVDVGGGIGMALSEIISVYPEIRGINLDLPHVAASAPSLPGIEHVGGNMFESVPSGDAIFMKNVLHGWDDEHCIKILKNCCMALPEHGKVIMIEAVMNPSDHETKTEQMKLSLDLVMMAHGTGRERTEKHWTWLLGVAGFPSVKFVRKEHCTRSVIEAFKLSL